MVAGVRLGALLCPRNEERFLLALPAGWAGVASAFPSFSELCEQTGNQESD